MILLNEQMTFGIIDLHVHLFPVRVFEAIWRYFDGVGWGVHREQVDEIAQTLRRHGVGLATGLSYPHKPAMARSLNRFMASVGEADGLFRPFASVHVDDEDLRAVVDEVLASPHLHGFKFQPLVQRFDINDPRLDYLYARCCETDFPILIHAGKAPVQNEHVGLVHFARLTGRFPELRICVAHMGLPEGDGFLRLCADHPRMFLDTAMINTRTDLFANRWQGDEELLRRHADRICFGSDWPHVPYPYQEALDSVARFPLPAEARDGVMAANASRFLRLDSTVRDP